MIKGRRFRNSEGLSAEAIALLQLDLQRLDHGPRGGAREALRFAVDGTPEKALDTLSMRSDSSRLLRLLCTHPRYTPEESAARRILLSRAEGGAVLDLRPARIWDAACAGERPQQAASVPSWVEVFAFEAAAVSPYCPIPSPSRSLSYSRLEAMLELDGQPRGLLLRSTLLEGPTLWRHAIFTHLLLGIEGFGHALREDAALIEQALRRPDVSRLPCVIEIVSRLPGDISPFLETLVEIALSPQERGRAEARRVIATRLRERAFPLIERAACDGDGAQRLQAATLLCHIEQPQWFEAPAPDDADPRWLAAADKEAADWSPGEPAADYRLPVICDDIVDFLVGYSGRVSQQGIFVPSTAPSTIHDRVEVRIALPDGTALIEAIGRVTAVWPTAGGGAAEAGIVVCFERISAGSLSLIEAMIVRRKADLTIISKTGAAAAEFWRRLTGRPPLRLPEPMTTEAACSETVDAPPGS